jgi:hypothetical protein
MSFVLSRVSPRSVRLGVALKQVCVFRHVESEPRRLQVFTDPEGKDPFLRSARLPEGGSLKSPNLAVINVNLVGVLNTVHVAIGEGPRAFLAGLKE